MSHFLVLAILEQHGRQGLQFAPVMPFSLPTRRRIRLSTAPWSRCVRLPAQRGGSPRAPWTSCVRPGKSRCSSRRKCLALCSIVCNMHWWTSAGGLCRSDRELRSKLVPHPQILSAVMIQSNYEILICQNELQQPTRATVCLCCVVLRQLFLCLVFGVQTSRFHLQKWLGSNKN